METIFVGLIKPGQCHCVLTVLVNSPRNREPSLIDDLNLYFP